MATEASTKEERAHPPQAFASHSNGVDAGTLEGTEQVTKTQAAESLAKKGEGAAQESSKQAAASVDTKNLNSAKPRKRTKTGCLSESYRVPCVSSSSSGSGLQSHSMSSPPNQVR